MSHTERTLSMCLLVAAAVAVVGGQQSSTATQRIAGYLLHDPQCASVPHAPCLVLWADDDGRIYQISKQALAKSLSGWHVVVTGGINGESIAVGGIQPVAPLEGMYTGIVEAAGSGYQLNIQTGDPMDRKTYPIVESGNAHFQVGKHAAIDGYIDKDRLTALRYLPMSESLPTEVAGTLSLAPCPGSAAEVCARLVSDDKKLDISIDAKRFLLPQNWSSQAPPTNGAHLLISGKLEGATISVGRAAFLPPVNADSALAAPVSLSGYIVSDAGSPVFIDSANRLYRINNPAAIRGATPRQTVIVGTAYEHSLTVAQVIRTMPATASAANGESRRFTTSPLQTSRGGRQPAKVAPPPSSGLLMDLAAPASPPPFSLPFTVINKAGKRALTGIWAGNVVDRFSFEVLALRIRFDADDPIGLVSFDSYGNCEGHLHPLESDSGPYKFHIEAPDCAKPADVRLMPDGDLLKWYWIGYGYDPVAADAGDLVGVPRLDAQACEDCDLLLQNEQAACDGKADCLQTAQQHRAACQRKFICH